MVGPGRNYGGKSGGYGGNSGGYNIVQALPCPFHSEGFQPSPGMGSLCSCRIASTAPRPSVSIRSNNALPTFPIPCFSYAKPSAFHWPRQPLPAHFRCKFPTHRTKPPTLTTHKLHAIAHSVLVKFLCSRAQPPRTQSVVSRFF